MLRRIRIPVAVNLFEAMAFSRHPDLVIRGLENLKPYTIAIRIGSKYAEALAENFDVTKFPAYEKRFMLLSEGR